MLGVSAVLIQMSSVIPIVYEVWQTEHQRPLNASWLLMSLLGNILYFLYGWIVQDHMIMGLAGCLVAAFMFILYKQQDIPHKRGQSL